MAADPGKPADDARVPSSKRARTRRAGRGTCRRPAVAIVGRLHRAIVRPSRRSPLPRCSRRGWSAQEVSATITETMPVVGRIAFFRLWRHVRTCSTKTPDANELRVDERDVARVHAEYGRASQTRLGGGIALGRGLQPEEVHGAAFVDRSTVLWRRSTVRSQRRRAGLLSSSSTSGQKPYLDTGSRMESSAARRRPRDALPRAGARLIRITTSWLSMSRPGAAVHPPARADERARARSAACSSPAHAPDGDRPGGLGWSSRPGLPRHRGRVLDRTDRIARSTFLRIARCAQPRCGSWPWSRPMPVVAASTPTTSGRPAICKLLVDAHAGLHLRAAAPCRGRRTSPPPPSRYPEGGGQGF